MQNLRILLNRVLQTFRAPCSAIITLERTRGKITQSGRAKCSRRTTTFSCFPQRVEFPSFWKIANGLLPEPDRPTGLSLIEYISEHGLTPLTSYNIMRGLHMALQFT